MPIKMAGKYTINGWFLIKKRGASDRWHIFFTHIWVRNSIKLILFNPKLALMNYPVSSSTSRELFTFIIRLSLILLLFFFVVFFVIEMI
jgi:hypothetical protein